MRYTRKNTNELVAVVYLKRVYPGALAKKTALRYHNVIREMIVQYVRHAFNNMRGAHTSRRVPAF